MLRLKTRWGMYILSNALKVDIFTEKEKASWNVYLSIDSYKHLLLRFESERDAIVFASMIRDNVEDFLSTNPNDPDQMHNLDQWCKAALHETEQQGLVE